SGGVCDGSYQGAVARRLAALRGQRGVGVGRDPESAARHRVGGLSELGPPDGCAVALDDRSDDVTSAQPQHLTGLHYRDALIDQGSEDARTADWQRKLPVRDGVVLPQIAGGDLGAVEHLVVLRLDAQRPQLAGDLLWQASGVVGEEEDLEVSLTSGLQAGHRAVARRGASVDHAVQVTEQSAVGHRADSSPFAAGSSPASGSSEGVWPRSGGSEGVSSRAGESAEVSSRAGESADVSS